MRKKVNRFIAVLMTMVCFTACGKKETKEVSLLPTGAAENEILTLTPVDQDKEMVTIHYEYGLDNPDEVEEAIEEEFSNVDVVMVHDGANDSYNLLMGNLENGTECDLIFSRAFRYFNENDAEYLLDLSGEEFINNFYLTSLDSCVQSDGGLYFLPGPSNVYGIIYDKTLFEEHGWSEPKSYSEFVQLIHTIDSAGLTAVEEIDGKKQEVNLRAFRPSLYYADSFQALLYPFIYKELFSGKENFEWLLAYQRGEETMINHMEPFADRLKVLLEDEVIRLGDWDYMPRYRLPMLCQYHSTAMILGAQNIYVNDQVKNSDHEYAMMPLWTSDEEDGDYLYSIPNYYMGINKAATSNPERKKLLLDIMGFILSPLAQDKLFGEANGQVSNIKGVTSGENQFNSGIQKTIKEGRIITDFSLLGTDISLREVETQLSDTARDMLSGNITVEQWLKGGDEVRDKKLAGESMFDPSNYGTCEESLTRLETALLMGQVYRDLTGAQIGLVYVNVTDQGAHCPVFKGTLNTKTVLNMAPDRTSSEEEGIASGTLTGQQILDCLNGIVTPSGASDSWYYVASGLTVEFAPWMPAGKRLVSCKLPDGSELNPDGTYTVAFMSDKLYGISEEKIMVIHPEDIKILEGKWSDLFPQWLSEQGGVLRHPEQTTVLNWKTEE